MINFKEQTLFEVIKEVFQGKDVKIQYTVLDHRIDLYFHDYKLTKEADKLGYNDKNIDYKIQRQKVKEK